MSSKKTKYHDKFFTEREIEECLSVIDGEKTFGDIDTNFFTRETPDKGLLGHFMEMSILGMARDSLQKADLKITYKDGSCYPTELKTTGVHDRGLETGEVYHVKECTSLTAVSIGTIEKETWEKSHYYEKLAHLLWVFYFYKRDAGQERVPYSEYYKFPVLGYTFTHIVNRPDDLAKFRSDWEKTQQFIIQANKENNPEELYPELHAAIKKDLFFVDIAPRYRKSDPANNQKAQTPRFRIKKPYVNKVFQEFWREKTCKKTMEALRKEYASMDAFEADLKKMTKKYKGKTVGDLAKTFGIVEKDCELDKLKKNVSEKIASRMFGCKAKTLNEIDFFNELGIIAKTVALTNKNLRTEDMKLFTMDLDQISEPKLPYEETSFVEYFTDYQLLCIIFKEKSANAPLKDNEFVGFKRLVFPDTFVEGRVEEMYKETCRLVQNNAVEERFCYDRKGKKIKNKNGQYRVMLNFPKSRKYDVFVRGTGVDSSKKTWLFKGKSLDGSGLIKSYALQFWLKGTYVAKALGDIKNYI